MQDGIQGSERILGHRSCQQIRYPRQHQRGWVAQGFRIMLSRFAASILLVVCLPAPAMTQSTILKPVILIHGNYCGPGNNAPLAPIDALDAACAQHDMCTPDNALPVKSCNLRLEREAAEIANDPRQPQDLRSVAGLISVGASMMLSAADSEPGGPTKIASGHLEKAVQKSRLTPTPTMKSRHNVQ